MPDEPADTPATTPFEVPQDVPADGGDLMARLKELESRVSADAPAPEPPPTPEAGEPVTEPVTATPEVAAPVAATPAKPPTKAAAVPLATPVKKAPAKKAPAKKAAKAPATKRTPPKKVAVPDLGSTPATPWPVSQAPLPLPAEPRPAAVPPPVPAVVATETTVPAREGDGLLRFLVMLAVLLLAAAAGLGAAAFVEHRDTSYRAVLVVQLTPGPDPAGSVEDAIAQGVTRYVSQASAPTFTETAARRADVAGSDVKGDVMAKQRGTDQVELEVRASTAAQAKTLAAGAGDALVELVNLDQVVSQPSAGDRLSAAVIGEPERIGKAAPKDRDAWIAGALAAGAVLVLAAVAAVLRVSRRP
ncbi:MAG: hypothetical protein ABR549_10465 [Mycobacteriales bacterium]